MFYCVFIGILQSPEHPNAKMCTPRRDFAHLATQSFFEFVLFHKLAASRRRSRCYPPGSRFQAPGVQMTTSRNPESNVWGSGFKPPGSRFQRPGSRFQPPDATFQGPDSNLQGSRCKPPGVQILTFRGPDSNLQGPDLNVQGPVSTSRVQIPKCKGQDSKLHGSTF